MVIYLVGMADAFVPLAAIIGLLIALSSQRLSRRALVAGFWCIILGLAAGWEAHLRAGPRGSLVETRTLFDAMAIACVLVVLLAVALRNIPAAPLRAAGFPGGLVVVAVLSAQAMFSFLEMVADQSFSVTTVLNTELVLNLAAILAGIVVIGLLGVLTAHAGRLAGVGATTALLAAILALQVIAWMVSGMLGLLQMRLLEITSGRVAFVAKSTELLPLAIYLHLALLALLAWFSYKRRPQPDISGTKPSTQRKILAVAQTERRWLRGTAAAVAFLVAVLLYNDLYASLPPTLSPAAEKTPDDTGMIRIPINEVTDGQLHRYAYITEDGHRVRFVLINRYDVDHVKIGVVFDACTICGDSGYIQSGHEVMCAACNVRIFVPSIGKAGGCNPIPLPHVEEAGDIVIDVAELEKGGRYFTEVVARTVKDPVSGDMVVSRSAPFRYEHDGKTYYFSGRESYDAFRADPDKFAVRK